MNLLRFFLVFLSLLGPPVGQATSAQFAEEEVVHADHAAAVELRVLGLQPPPPLAVFSRVAARRAPRLVRRRVGTGGRGRRHRPAARVSRRLLYSDGDDDPDSLR